MHSKTFRLLATATVVLACSSLMLGFLSAGYFLRRPESNLITTISSDATTLELVSGTGPNLMTPQRYDSTDDLIDTIDAEFKDEWIVGGEGSITRRYMSALIAGEGCKSYVDNGDGIWVPIANDTSDPIEFDASSNPFGCGGSNSNPFE